MKHRKSQYPTSMLANDYNKNPKRSTITTPQWLADYIFTIVNKKLEGNTIIDVGCHSGNLSRPFASAGFKCVGIDNKKVKYHSTFFEFNFLRMPSTELTKDLQAIVCNPPFNDEKKQYGKKLIPELFLRQIFNLWHYDTPVILFSPFGILKNQRINSDRWKWIRDCGAKITSELELPIDTYGQGVLVHSSVLFFNIPGLPAKMFLEGV